jgi:thioredoxin reductase
MATKVRIAAAATSVAQEHVDKALALLQKDATINALGVLMNPRDRRIALLEGQMVGSLLRLVACRFETSHPGVFAIGDVRSGSVKRVAAAVGEGAQVVAMLHGFLAKARL